MKQAIGTTQIITYIMIFIVITFCFLIATLSYMKAFKVNSKIASSIEKYEGYNGKAEDDITTYLNSIGYEKGKAKCPGGGQSLPEHNTCVSMVGNLKKGNFIRYKITTYIKFGPILGTTFRIPINSQTEKIYVFSE